jgi:hypothetical protein
MIAILCQSIKHERNVIETLLFFPSQIDHTSVYKTKLFFECEMTIHKKLNVQRTLGDISDNSYEGDVKLPSDLTHGNPVFDLNDDDPNND